MYVLGLLGPLATAAELERAVAADEGQISTLGWLLTIFTFVVVAGVLLEILPVLSNGLKKHEKRFEILGAIIIALGITAEWLDQSRISVVERDLRARDAERVERLRQDSNVELEEKYQRSVAMGDLSAHEAQAREGVRSAFDALTKRKRDDDPEVARSAGRRLQSIADDFQRRLNRDRLLDENPLDLLRNCNTGYMTQRRYSKQEDLPGVVEIIRNDADLYCVATAFETFSWMPEVNTTGTQVKMFDFNAVNAWCSRNKPKCGAD